MKRLVTGMIAALVLGGLALSPVHAQEEPTSDPVEVPETVQIEDPLEDANGLNDQGNRGDIGFQGDHGTPTDAGSVSDLIKVWFTHDVETVSIHFNTQAAAPASSSTLFQAFSNPGGDFALGCLRWAILIPGAYQGQPTTYQGPPLAKLIDRCNDEGTSFYNNGTEGTINITEGPDVPQQTTGEAGPSGILSATFPRAYSPLLADGLSITKVFAETKVAIGADAVGNATPATLDNTMEGTDYVLTAAPAPMAEPTKPPWKKGCKKGSPKAKKKGCRKPR
ncbi:MAG: hypothetical protein ACRDKT_01420 [Actinomycetota bacterium]